MKRHKITYATYDINVSEQAFKKVVVFRTVLFIYTYKQRKNQMYYSVWVLAGSSVNKEALVFIVDSPQY